MKILAISEYAARGSGYTSILMGMLGEWERRRHEVVCLAFDYLGSEHPHKATIIPTDPNMLMRQFPFIMQGYRPDVIVVIFDLSLHHSLRHLQNMGVPYIGIFPIEADPVIHPSDWTNTIDTMDVALCETRFGTEALRAHGIRATYFPVAVDDFWCLPTDEERAQARERWNLGERFVVLTVGDNQERKNWPTHFAAIALLAGKTVEWPPGSKPPGPSLATDEMVPDVYWILNTKKRPQRVGYNNFELSQRFGIAGNTLVLEHLLQEGLERERLRELYWAADAFLLLSKAEGLGIPVLEAMATGTHVVGTDCTGIAESLAEGRGFLVPAEYTHIDPFHNQYRRWASPYLAAKALSTIAHDPEAVQVTEWAHDYARSLTWLQAGNVFEEALRNVESRSPTPEAPSPEDSTDAIERATEPV